MDTRTDSRLRVALRGGTTPPTRRDLTAREKGLLRALIGFQVFDGAATALSAPWVVKCLDDVNCPQGLRPWLPAIKAASVVGLLGGGRFPRLARATSVGLATYFTVAIASHLRARDISPNLLAACLMLGFVTAATRPFWRPAVPDRARSRPGPAPSYRAGRAAGGSYATAAQLVTE